MTNTTEKNVNPLGPPSKGDRRPMGENLRMTYSFEGSGPQMEDFGLNPPLYSKLLQAAQETDSIIMIRKTNRGSVIPLDQIGAVGKKLATKGKSSSAYFTNGSITFLGCLAKKVGNLLKEQEALINILGVETDPTRNTTNRLKYTYIPKFISLKSQNWPVPYRSLNGDENAPPPEGEPPVYECLENNSCFYKVKLSLVKDKLAHTVENTQRDDALNTLYILKKVKFSEFRKVNNLSIATPYFLGQPEDGTAQNSGGAAQSSNDCNDDCFQVYIRSDAVNVEGLLNEYKQKCEQKKAEINADTKLEPDNKEKQVSEIEQNFSLLNATFTRDAAEIEVNGIKYREARVLAIGTHNNPQGSDKPKQYYEIVADYDLFTIAPSTERFLQGSKKPENPKNIEFNLWPTERSYEDFKEFIPIAYPNYGIASAFDLNVRREINSSLKNKAVQHGVEINNLFYVSELFEPLIFINPNSEGVSNTPEKSDLFFLSPELFFDIHFTHRDNSTHRVISESGERSMQGLLGSAQKVNVIYPHKSLMNKYLFRYNFVWEYDKTVSAQENHNESNAIWWKYIRLSTSDKQNVEKWCGKEFSEKYQSGALSIRFLALTISNRLNKLYEDKNNTQRISKADNTMITKCTDKYNSEEYKQYLHEFYHCIAQLQLTYFNAVGILMMLNIPNILNEVHTSQENINSSKGVYFELIRLVNNISTQIERNFLSFNVLSNENFNAWVESVQKEGSSRNNKGTFSYTKLRELYNPNLEKGAKGNLLAKHLEYRKKPVPPQECINKLNCYAVQGRAPFQFKFDIPETQMKEACSPVSSPFLTAFYSWKFDMEEVCKAFKPVEIIVPNLPNTTNNDPLQKSWPEWKTIKNALQNTLLWKMMKTDITRVETRLKTSKTH